MQEQLESGHACISLLSRSFKHRMLLLPYHFLPQEWPVQLLRKQDRCSPVERGSINAHSDLASCAFAAFWMWLFAL